MAASGPSPTSTFSDLTSQPTPGLALSIPHTHREPRLPRYKRPMSPPLSDLHMLALNCILDHELVLPADLAAGLGLPQLVAELLCAEHRAAGFIAPTPD